MARLRTITMIVLACALAACGRRGPLEPPPGSVPSPRVESGLADPQGRANATRPSLTRNTLDDVDPARQQGLASPTATTVPRTPFFLDPLL